MKSSRCARCGGPMPEGARACPRCGLHREVTIQPPVGWRPGPALIGSGILALVALIAIIVAIVAGFRTRSVTIAAPGQMPPMTGIASAPSGVPSNSGVVSAPQGSPPLSGVVAAPPGVPNAAGQSAPANPKPKPPAEVVDYLEHVRTVEYHRQNVLLKDIGKATSLLQAGQVQGLMNILDMVGDPSGENVKSPLEKFATELGRQYQNWLSTVNYFDSKSAPEQCREFGGAYRQALVTETQLIGEVAQGLASTDITSPDAMEKLLAAFRTMSSSGNLQQQIDYYVDLSDTKLNELVSQYDMQKPFSVLRERGNPGNIMGL
jgi:hypothetical protein